MCVAIVAESKLPDHKTLIKCEDANPDGGGIAWLDEESHLVRWKKGLSATEINDLIEAKDIRPPCFIHFRIATAGGKDQSLCHPFPVTRRVSTELEGTAARVLMHNGHWDGWSTRLLFGVISKESGKMPAGKWSDTRAMAYLVGRYGDQMMDLIPAANKIATLDKTGKVVTSGFFTERDGIKYSNMSWDYRSVRPKIVQTGWDWDERGWCGKCYSWKDEDRHKEQCLTTVIGPNKCTSLVEVRPGFYTRVHDADVARELSEKAKGGLVSVYGCDEDDASEPVGTEEIEASGKNLERYFSDVAEQEKRLREAC